MSPVLKKMVDEGNDGVKYFDIANSDFDYANTFYFVSTLSPYDQKQLQRVGGMTNIHIIRFRNPHHGIPFLKCSLPRVMNMGYDELCRLETKEHRPVLFDLKMAGVAATLKCLFKIIAVRLKMPRKKMHAKPQRGSTP